MNLIKSSSFSKKAYILQYLKKSLPNFIFDLSVAEGNNFTLPEIKTLLDGVTVGGHLVSDEQQIYNLKRSWEFLIKSLQNSTFQLNRDFWLKLHSLVAFEEALTWGEFRTDNISIGGTEKYTCPNHNELGVEFERMVINFNCKEYATVEESIIELYLTACYNQYFFDGNKRTARLIVNGLLIMNEIGLFTVKREQLQEYNELMIAFYDSNDRSRIKEFLISNCIIRL